VVATQYNTISTMNPISQIDLTTQALGFCMISGISSGGMTHLTVQKVERSVAMLLKALEKPF